MSIWTTHIYTYIRTEPSFNKGQTPIYSHALHFSHGGSFDQWLVHAFRFLLYCHVYRVTAFPSFTRSTLPSKKKQTKNRVLVDANQLHFQGNTDTKMSVALLQIIDSSEHAIPNCRHDILVLSSCISKKCCTCRIE